MPDWRPQYHRCCHRRTNRQGDGLGLWRDRRGAVAFEAPFVFGLLVLALLLPMADFAVAGFKLISGYEALRNAGQYIQYHAPPDVTNWSSWAASLPTAVKAPGGYTISNINVWCGDSSRPCSSTNTASPKYYSMTTSVTLTPMVLRSALCPTVACTFTLSHSERFQ